MQMKQRNISARFYRNDIIENQDIKHNQERGKVLMKWLMLLQLFYVPKLITKRYSEMFNSTAIATTHIHIPLK